MVVRVTVGEALKWFNDIARRHGPWCIEDVQPLVDHLNKSIDLSVAMLPHTIASAGIRSVVEAWKDAERDASALLKSLKTLQRHLSREGEVFKELDTLTNAVSVAFLPETELFNSMTPGRKQRANWKLGVIMYGPALLRVVKMRQPNAAFTSPGPATQLMATIIERLTGEVVAATTIAREMRADRREGSKNGRIGENAGHIAP